MKASALRHLWFLIEETQTSTLLGFSDAELIQQLLRQVEQDKLLTGEESNTMQAYIRSRVPLIRDLAQARMA
ncbi:hypothetical protein [Dendronalium phyllosphericum]|uniref:hypothetical protein n=1 Tax=Dendronalium phyllosphericum TaxID=2840445 RepID=UPI00298F0A3E|nr:hypothetical protein [Dendronalium phyllosphericum]